MLFDDDDEFLETGLCSAESLHYAWPNFLLLNSRNALMNGTETSEISIWGEVPVPGSLTKGVINRHPFFLWPLPNWPSEGLSQQAVLGLSAVLCIPQPCYLPHFLGKQGAHGCGAVEQLPKSKVWRTVYYSLTKRKNTTKDSQTSVPNRYKMSLQLQGFRHGLNIFKNVCIKNSDVLKHWA